MVRTDSFFDKQSTRIKSSIGKLFPNFSLGFTSILKLYFSQLYNDKLTQVFHNAYQKGSFNCDEDVNINLKLITSFMENLISICGCPFVFLFISISTFWIVLKALFSPEELNYLSLNFSDKSFTVKCSWWLNPLCEMTRIQIGLAFIY